MSDKTCCFIGHRKIEITDTLREILYSTISDIIIKSNITTFLFGSKSQFNDLCYEITSTLKITFPQIKRIYVRAEYSYIDNEYKSYLLQSYEETYYPPNLINSGRAAYIKRNYEMIDKSNLCIFYFDKNYQLQEKNSGTKLAYIYAESKNKKIINIYKNEK